MQIDVTAARHSFGSTTLFDGLTASFLSNRLSALVGPSGSGKSTLLGLMAGYGQLDEGHVHFVGPGATRRQPKPEFVAWVPQGANALGKRTALDNVMIGALANGYSLRDAESLSLSALRDVGLGDEIHKMVQLLSGGQVQRIAFARALASTRPVIFADEPSASLDTDNTNNIARLLRELRHRVTIVVSTHDPILIAAAEHVIHLRQTG